MRIEKLHIDSFMGTHETDIEFARGVNIIRGNNESGKSTVAEFIKFMLYGASSRGEGGMISERQKYLSFGDTSFGGYMELYTNDGHYRIDRTVSQTQSGSFRESLAVTDLEKKAQVFKGENAGEALLKMPENLFKKVAYISQESEAYTGGAELGSAVENLLFSGDETVSTDKSLKKLDSLRVSLLHKNGKGGQIFEYEKDRTDLESRIEKAMNENIDIIAKEVSLADTDRRIEENRTEYAAAKKICELYDNYVAFTKFTKLDDTKDEIKATDEKISELDSRFDGFVPNGEYLGRLRQSAEQVQNAAMSVEVARKKLEKLTTTRTTAEEKAAETCDTTEAAASAKKVHSVKMLSSLLLTLGVVFMLLGAAAIGCAYLMRLEGIFYTAGGVAIALGLVLTVASILNGKKLKTLLSTYGVSSEYELSEKVAEIEENAARSKDLLSSARENENAARALLENEENRLASVRSDFAKEAGKVGGSEEEANALFANLEAYISERGELSEKKKILSDREKELTKETNAYNREEVETVLRAIKDIAIFSSIDITEYRRKRDFCENAISALEIKKNELEKSLAALHATVEDPALLKAKLGELCKKERDAKAKYAAATLAMSAIEKASAGLRTRVSPRLAEYAGKLMNVMTNGKYSEFGVDGEMELTFVAKGGAHEVSFLSKGTRESAYFALRLALCDLLCKEEKLPLVLDECFAHADDTRTKQMIKILMALAADNTQSLVLTCHTRDEKIASEVGTFNLIEL